LCTLYCIHQVKWLQLTVLMFKIFENFDMGDQLIKFLGGGGLKWRSKDVSKVSRVQSLSGQTVQAEHICSKYARVSLIPGGDQKYFFPEGKGDQPTRTLWLVQNRLTKLHRYQSVISRGSSPWNLDIDWNGKNISLVVD